MPFLVYNILQIFKSMIIIMVQYIGCSCTCSILISVAC